MPNPIVPHVDFVDGIRRTIFEGKSSRQYVFDNDGERVYGVWFIPREDCDRPIMAQPHADF